MRLATRVVPVTLALAAISTPARLHAQDSTRAAAPPTATAAAPAPVASAPPAGGVVQPGMSEAQVRAAWGEPLVVRTLGAHTYVYYRNDCPKAKCGMNDVVILEQGQVVDAVVRSSAHRYGGVSSSPAARAASPTVDSDSGRAGP
jgi:hypothetical protein